MNVCLQGPQGQIGEPGVTGEGGEKGDNGHTGQPGLRGIPGPDVRIALRVSYYRFYILDVNYDMGYDLILSNRFFSTLLYYE